MNKKQVALFGGAFDPVTLAHEFICQKIHDETGFDIWLMPCWNHKFGKDPTPIYHRWAMLALACQKMPFVKLCSWEIDKQHSGSMYETMLGLKASFQDIDFHIVIGMDNANVILESWDRGQWIVLYNPFIVITRTGEESTATWYNVDPHKLIKVDYNLSSTKVRTAITEANEEACNMVSPNVWTYINQNCLYGSKSCNL
jgi:nicotinate (nicotinamide) nucleotide adenylyltransferase